MPNVALVDIDGCLVIEKDGKLILNSALISQIRAHIQQGDQIILFTQRCGGVILEKLKHYDGSELYMKTSEVMELLKNEFPDHLVGLSTSIDGAMNPEDDFLNRFFEFEKKLLDFKINQAKDRLRPEDFSTSEVKYPEEISKYLIWESQQVSAWAKNHPEIKLLLNYPVDKQDQFKGVRSQNPGGKFKYYDDSPVNLEEIKDGNGDLYKDGNFDLFLVKDSCIVNTKDIQEELNKTYLELEQCRTNLEGKLAAMQTRILSNKIGTQKDAHFSDYLKETIDSFKLNDYDGTISFQIKKISNVLSGKKVGSSTGTEFVEAYGQLQSAKNFSTALDEFLKKNSCR
jgi:ASC-1-like (ASCH) protein